MKWIHSRKGEIEGKIIREDEDFVDIELANIVRVGSGSPAEPDGFREVYAHPKEILRVKKSLLTEMG